MRVPAYSGAQMDTLRAHLRDALTTEATLRGALESAPDTLWAPYAAPLRETLPAFDLLVTLPGAEALALALAAGSDLKVVQAGSGLMREPHARGERWSLALAPLISARAALLVTPYLGLGVNELEVASLVRQGGAAPVGLACGLERTDLGGRNRLEQQGLAVAACAQVVSTPSGLIFERRVLPEGLGGQGGR